MAGGMEGDWMREECADVGDSEFINEQFGKFEDAREQFVHFLDEFGVGGVRGHHREVFTNHGHAGGGGDADDLRAEKDFQKMAHERERFFLVSGVVVHLPAAGLGFAELDGVAEAFEDGNDGFSGLGEESVVVAGDE